MALFGGHHEHHGQDGRDGHDRHDPMPEDPTVAMERYEYVLATAQPDRQYAVHAEAFGRLTDAEREELRARLAEAVPPADAPIDARPETLARVATDAERTASGSLARILGPLLPTVAAVVVASPPAIALFPYEYGAVTGQWAEDAEEDGGFF
ncbi:hypothetical protein [Leifsonia sp. NPDC080035]|uniref:Uncharacterized protein n=1 Tax=Leifsonia sp. NPDC080035 TaxID=3143936 RepID=A0AAU7GB41_9MICO